MEDEMPTAPDLPDAPLPRDLRRLAAGTPYTPDELAKRADITPKVLGQIMYGRLIPSVDEVRAICRACGVRGCRRFVALATRYDSDDAFRYMARPDFKPLRDHAKGYFQRSHVSILRPAEPDWPLRFHTISATYDRVDGPSWNPDMQRWELSGDLWDLVKELESVGVLVANRDKSGRYLHSWCTPDDDAEELVEDRAGRVSRRRGANVVFQLCPRPKKDKDTGKLVLPKINPCRIYIADVYAPDSPVSKLWLALVGPDGMESMHFTRRDLATPTKRRLRAFSLEPKVGKGSKRGRRMFDDVAVERYGPKGKSSRVIYEDEERGHTQIEWRDRYDPKHPERYWPRNMAKLPNPYVADVLWDLRTAGVVDPFLRDTLVRAQESGLRRLPKVGRAKVLRQVCQVSYQDDDGMWVHPDKNHPAHLFERYYHAELRRLAKRLGVPTSFFGLRDQRRA